MQHPCRAAAVFLGLLTVANVIVVQQHGVSDSDSPPLEEVTDVNVPSDRQYQNAWVTNRCLLPYRLPPARSAFGVDGCLFPCAGLVHAVQPDHLTPAISHLM